MWSKSGQVRTGILNTRPQFHHPNFQIKNTLRSEPLKRCVGYAPFPP